MDDQTPAVYQQQASELVSEYESVDGGISRFFPFLYHKGDEVLDIGAGSGRDCARLAGLGMDAWGIEPSGELRAHSLRMHPGLKGKLLQGALPDDLGAVLGRQFDGVIANAVLMHVPDAELFDSAIAIRSFLRPGGHLLISVSTTRDDIDSLTERDSAGRLFVKRTAGEYRLLFERIGFCLDSQWESVDDHRRANIEWATLAFTYQGSSPRPIDRIEAIINRDRKTSTYKLALLRALAEIAVLSPGIGRVERTGEVSIGLEDVAELWVRYYWPIVASPMKITQNWNGRGSIRFRSELESVIGHYEGLNGLPVYVDHLRTGRIPKGVGSAHRELIRQVVAAIKTGPVMYAGEHEFYHERGRIVLQHDLWRELTLMGHWIGDSIILRWADLTASKSGNRVRTSEMVDLLLHTGEDARMDVATRSFYKSQTDLRCAWSGRRLSTTFQVDHIIPYSLRKDSSLWNLVPTSRRLNISKRDRLPTIDLIRDSGDRIIADWRRLRDWQPERFLADAIRLASSALDPNWEKPLLTALMEAVEYTATLRGVDRWAV